MAGVFASEVTFFSVGTNDLTQYVMAGDRLNPAMTDLLQPLQPAVVHAIAALVDAARPAGRHVGVCGEMAADPRMALLLVGLGVSDLSMNPVSIPAVKATLATYSADEARARAARALAAVTLAQVQAAVAEIRVEEP
jgi:phosphoenolpyruvate-protein kinase (PTS system EI component)